MPIFLKPPFGMQAAQACELQLPPCEHPLHFFEYEVATRRMIFDRSRKSILRRISSAVVPSSSASISMVLERPSDNSFKSCSILPNQQSDMICNTLYKERTKSIIQSNQCCPLCRVCFLISCGKSNDTWHVKEMAL